MTKIIETHLQLDEENNIVDHQSRVIKIEESWNDYCQAFLQYDGTNSIKFINHEEGLLGDTLPPKMEIIDSDYMDDYHLQFKIKTRVSGYIVHLAFVVSEYAQ